MRMRTTFAMATIAAFIAGLVGWAAPADGQVDDAYAEVVERMRIAWAEDDFPAMHRAIGDAVSLGQDRSFPSLVLLARRLEQEMRPVERAYRSIRRPLSVLEDEPDHPSANQQAGLFYCLMKQEWDRGLPMLARAGREELARVAEAELASPRGREEWLALGDDWWDVSARLRGPQEAAAQRRAVYWYGRVLRRQDGVAILDDASRARLGSRMQSYAAAAYGNQLVYDPPVVELLQELEPEHLDLAFGVQIMSPRARRRRTVNFRIHMDVDNQSQLAVIDGEMRVDIRVLLQDGAGDVNVHQRNRRFSLAARTLDETRVRTAATRDIRDRNADNHEPHNIYMEVRVDGTVVRRLLSGPPEPWPWWRDESLVR